MKADPQPVFFGHYRMTAEVGVPDLTRAPNFCCLDFSIARPGGILAAYRWDGEERLSADRLVWARGDLLERIVAASSNPGDIVLDPFCGCGTTVHAAQKLGRRWIGIDVTHLAISLIERRLRDAFGTDADFETLGVPRDLDGAKALAEADKYEFEKWAVSLIRDAQPWKGGKKGADRGIDGVLYVGQKSERCFISVKGGRNIGVAMLRDLVGVLDREKAPMGLFVTLYEPTKPMIAEAASAGHWAIDGFEPVPKVQIITIEQLLTSVAPPFRMPLARNDTFKKAQRESRTDQGKLDL